MKAGVAAALIACRAALDAGARGRRRGGVRGRRGALLGGRAGGAGDGLTADAAIVTEPTNGEVIIAHKGFVWSEITFRGHAAHGSRADEGVDAIAKAGPVLVRLGALDTTLGVMLHPLLGRGSVHAGVISGGAELSTYPGECVLSIERRTLPGETAEAVEAEITGLLAGIGRDGADAARARAVRGRPGRRDRAARVRGVGRREGGRAVLDRRGVPRRGGHPDGPLRPARRGRARRRGVGVAVADTETVARTLVAVASEFCA